MIWETNKNKFRENEFYLYGDDSNYVYLVIYYSGCFHKVIYYKKENRLGFIKIEYPEINNIHRINSGVYRYYPGIVRLVQKVNKRDFPTFWYNELRKTTYYFAFDNYRPLGLVYNNSNGQLRINFRFDDGCNYYEPIGVGLKPSWYMNLHYIKMNDIYRLLNDLYRYE